MPSRRAFVAGTIAVLSARPFAPAWSDEKSSERVYRVGFLDTESAAANAANLVQFQKGMKELGYTEGRNLTSEYRSAEGRNERLQELAARLVRKKVDVIVTRGTPAALAAKNAPGETPVVTAGVVDPVETKLIDSFERPGGKVTGLGFTVKEVETKRIDLLRAVAPNRKRIAALLNMGNPAIAETWKVTEEAALSFGMQAMLFDVRKPEDAMAALQAAVEKQAEALIVRLGALGDGQRRAFVEAAARYKLPAVYGSRQYVDAGGLISYGVNPSHLYYRAASFVDRIFKGAKPGELPMEQPTKFEMIVNRKAVRSLGLVLPPDLLLRSDEII
ncbi:MAG: ABC transporter substrate-binding protein [Betaproteobacteria bacterium]|nr:ABC transporter substrate-binding protein [Betaproteobacteria bacterium]